MSLREWIFIVIAVLAVYLVFQLIRAMQVKDDAVGLPGDVLTEMPSELLDQEAASGGGVRLNAPDDNDSAPEGDAEATSLEAETVQTRKLAEESFALALEVRQLRRDIAQLREESDAQRGEITELRDTIDRQRQQIEATKAAQHVSPIYGEALALAQRGMGAEVIAERCSISVAEAELVRSLARDSSASGEEA